MKQIRCLMVLIVVCLSVACATTQGQRVEQNEVVQNQVEEPELTEVQKDWQRYNHLKSAVFVTNDEYREMLRLAKSLSEAGEHICSWGINPIWGKSTHDRTLDLIHDLDQYNMYYVGLIAQYLLELKWMNYGELEKAVFDYARRKGGTSEGQKALIVFFRNFPMKIQTKVFDDILSVYDVSGEVRHSMLHLAFVAKSSVTSEDSRIIKQEFSKLMNLSVKDATYFLWGALDKQWGIRAKYREQMGQSVGLMEILDNPEYVVEREKVYEDFYVEIRRVLHARNYDIEDDMDRRIVQWACGHVRSYVCSLL